MAEEKKTRRRKKTTAAETIKAETTKAETPAVKAAAEPAVEKSAESEKVERLEKLVETLMAQLADRNPQIVQVMADTEKVVMRFQADVSDDNLAVFGTNGMYGQVTGKLGTVIVPKSEWSRFYTETNRAMIDRRWLVVLSGMTEQERGLYNCMYRDGEVLDEGAFRKLLDMGNELLAVFPKLCVSHQEMVGRFFIEAYQNGDVRVTENRDLVLALNEESKKAYADLPAKDARRKGVFNPIIAEMNRRDEEA